MDKPKNGASGAFGFRLVYPAWGHASHDLVPLNGAAPEVLIEWRHACTVLTHDSVDEQHVSMGARGGSSFHVHRRPPSIVFDLEAAPSGDALVHPLLTAPIAVLARWRGDTTLHAGGFVTSSGAWALAGPRESGKSTMLALVALRGCPVVADDLLTVNDGSAWAGPRCVDLRPEAAAHFEHVRDIGMVGLRHRFRLSTAAAPPRSPLRGIFLLEWHDHPTVTLEPLSSAERLHWLYRMEYIPLVGPPEAPKVLDLLTLPAWRLARPRDWAATDDVVETMLGVAED